MVTFVAKGTCCPSLPQAAACWLGDAAPLDKRLLSAVCCQALFSGTAPGNDPVVPVPWCSLRGHLCSTLGPKRPPLWLCLSPLSYLFSLTISQEKFWLTHIKPNALCRALGPRHINLKGRQAVSNPFGRERGSGEIPKMVNPQLYCEAEIGLE